MNPLFRMIASISIAFAGFVFVPAVNALPAAGSVKDRQLIKTDGAPTLQDESNLQDLVKQVGLRIYVGYGRHGRYGRYRPRYYGYRRHYYPRYSYRRHYYRPYRSYRSYRSYRRPYRFKRRYKSRRSLRRLRRALRHGRYY